MEWPTLVNKEEGQQRVPGSLQPLTHEHLQPLGVLVSILGSITTVVVADRFQSYSRFLLSTEETDPLCGVYHFISPYWEPEMPRSVLGSHCSLSQGQLHRCQFWNTGPTVSFHLTTTTPQAFSMDLGTQGGRLWKCSCQDSAFLPTQTPESPSSITQGWLKSVCSRSLCRTQRPSPTATEC